MREEIVQYRPKSLRERGNYRKIWRGKSEQASLDVSSEEVGARLTDTVRH
jgi:hypothetical protein